MTDAAFLMAFLFNIQFRRHVDLVGDVFAVFLSLADGGALDKDRALKTRTVKFVPVFTHYLFFPAGSPASPAPAVFR